MGTTGSVLGPVMFAVYINDIDEGINSYMSLFTNNAKLLRRVSIEDSCGMLQQHLGKDWEWSCKWKMELNITKYKVMEFGKSKQRISGQHKLGGEIIKKLKLEKDLGVFGSIYIRQHVT